MTITGLLKLNKPLEGKAVEIHALDANQKIIGSSAELNIEGNSLINVNDVRKVTVSLFTKEIPSSYEIVVKDTWGLTLLDSYTDGMVNGIAGIIFGPPTVDIGKKGLIPSLQFKNPSGQNITIAPVAIELQINKLNGTNKEVVKSYKLTELKGLVPKESWYQAALPAWDLKDQNGKPIASGKYEVRINVPSTITYTVEGSSVKEKIENPAKFNSWTVDITQDQINKITNN